MKWLCLSVLATALACQGCNSVDPYGVTMQLCERAVRRRLPTPVQFPYGHSIKVIGQEDGSYTFSSYADSPSGRTYFTCVVKGSGQLSSYRVVKLELF